MIVHVGPGIKIDMGPARAMSVGYGALTLPNAVPIVTEPDLLSGTCRHGHVGQFERKGTRVLCRECRLEGEARYRAGIRKLPHPCERCGKGMARTRYCGEACKSAVRREKRKMAA